MTGRVHGCLECGATIARQSGGDFCAPPCRYAWNNRRKARGAMLLDLYMAHRFDRSEAARLGVFQAINRLASTFREEDCTRRDGRRSWRQPAEVLGERPYLRATRAPDLVVGRR